MLVIYKKSMLYGDLSSWFNFEKPVSVREISLTQKGGSNYQNLVEATFQHSGKIQV